MIDTELLKKHKICIYCCKNTARDGFSGCEECSNLGKEKRKKLKENPESICLQCKVGKVRTSVLRCKKCKKANFLLLNLQ